MIVEIQVLRLNELFEILLCSFFQGSFRNTLVLVIDLAPHPSIFIAGRGLGACNGLVMLLNAKRSRYTCVNFSSSRASLLPLWVS